MFQSSDIGEISFLPIYIYLDLFVCLDLYPVLFHKRAQGGYNM